MVADPCSERREVVNAVPSGRSNDVDVAPVFSVPASDREPRSDDLLAALERVESLPEANAVALVIDGEEIALPPPESVTVRASKRRVEVMREEPRVTLRWPRRDR